MLFDTDIADNIRYGAQYKEITQEDVVDAAKSANIHDFIVSLPKVGYINNCLYLVGSAK